MIILSVSNSDRMCNGSLSGSGPTRRLQRINSQEELDFHETSSGSDQSELGGEELSWSTNQEQTFERDMMQSPEHIMTKKNFRFQSKTSCRPQGRVAYQSGGRVQSNSRVTVPKPFQMMLREEERKRHRIRTRSEVELENSLLRRELEELRECQKKFRASPAPAHIHLPLYEIISRRHRGRNGSENIRDRNQESAEVSPQPFQFLERERRKREAKIIAELGKFHREERRTFKARAMPSSVYRSAKCPIRQHQFQTVFIMERESTEGQSDHSSDPEQEMQQADCCSDFSRSLRSSSSKPVKKQIEVSIQMVKEGK
uniref:Protein FAM161A n=1 Tax=Nothobranchius furzeri TaxID=105023 RepID=A0A1A8B9U9_NOTFU